MIISLFTILSIATSQTKPQPVPKPVVRPSGTIDVVAVGRNNVQSEQQVWAIGAAPVPMTLKAETIKQLLTLPKTSTAQNGYPYAFGLVYSPTIRDVTLELKYGNLNSDTKSFDSSFSGTIYAFRSTKTGNFAIPVNIRLPEAGEIPLLTLTYAAGDRVAIGELVRAEDGSFKFNGKDNQPIITLDKSGKPKVVINFGTKDSPVEIFAKYTGSRLTQINLFDANKPLKMTIEVADIATDKVSFMMRSATKKTYSDFQLAPVLDSTR